MPHPPDYYPPTHPAWPHSTAPTTGGRARDKIICARNLREIGQALDSYAMHHGGKYPDDLATLLSDEDLSPDVFVCPLTDDAPSNAPTTQQAVEDLKKSGHCSYIYLGKGLTQATGPRRVLALEPLSNHDDGIHALCADGSVEWTPAPEAGPLLETLGVPATAHGSATTPALRGL